jgi:hypothetical protein
VDGIGDGSIHGDRRDFPVTKLQHAHKASSGSSEARSLKVD